MQCIKCREEIPAGGSYCPFCGKKQVPEKRKALKRTNGMGTVYKLQGRRKRPWVAAKNKVIIGYYEKKQEAQEALERLAGKDLTERYNMTFKEVFEEWKKEHYREIGENGIASYKRAYDVFEPLHNRQFRSLKTKDFQAVIDQHEGKSHSTISKYKQLATQMSKWAMREGLITTNLASFIKVPENVKKEKEIFTDDDIKKLRADKSEAARIVLMLIDTGMRIGELFSLPLADYHKDYVIGGEKTEAGRNRTIPILKEGRCNFAYFAEHADGPLLLSGYTGQRDKHNFCARDYKPLLERLNIPYKTPHSTRHTYASRARKAGMDPETLKAILGHASYSTTVDFYYHATPEELVKAVDKCSIKPRKTSAKEAKKC